MSRVGYDPSQLSGVMAMLGEVSSSQDGQQTPEWLSTHPNPENREEDILKEAQRAEVAANPPLIREEPYLRHIDGLVYGEDPREGFFGGGGSTTRT